MQGRGLGITQEMIDLIPDGFEASDLFTDAEKALVAATVEITRTAKLSTRAFDRLARHFDERALVELMVNAGVANLNNRFTDALAADVEDQE